MENNEIRKYKIIIINNKKYRIINITKDETTLVKMNTSKLEFVVLETNYIIRNLQDGEIKIEDEEERVAFDINTYPSKTKDVYGRKLAMVNEIIRTSGPNLEKLIKNKSNIFKEFEKIATKYGFTKGSTYRIVRKYLQSGLDNYVLVSKMKDSSLNRKKSYAAKAGRKSHDGNNFVVTPDVERQFDQVLHWYLQDPNYTMVEAYKKLIQTYYLDDVVKVVDGIVTYDYSNCPSIYQFKYYKNKKISNKDEVIKDLGSCEFRNSLRVITGDTIKDVFGPGDILEMDECEVDVKLVSEYDPQILVSRPVVYIMKDAYTKLILAYSVSFENNSVRGLTNCLANLLVDKVALCKKYEIPLPEGFKWPYNIIPNQIRVDNGAEYLSKESVRIFNELNITKQVVPPASGSMKGNVEQFFHMMHTRQNPVFVKHGLIEKNPINRTKPNAVLNIKQFEVALLCYIVEHNVKKLEKYPLSPEMIKEGMPLCPTPLELWDFGVEHYGEPRPILDADRFKYTLLEEHEASFDRSGIIFKELSYFSILDSDLYKRLETLVDRRRQKITIRVDSRDISNVYRLVNGKVVATPLSENRVDSSTFKGWSLPEYENYKSRLNKARKEASESNIMNALVTSNLQGAIVNEAKKKQVGKPSNKNLRVNAQIEKNHNRKTKKLFEPDITNSIDCTQQFTSSSTQEFTNENTSGTKGNSKVPVITTDAAKAIQKFFEEEYEI